MNSTKRGLENIFDRTGFEPLRSETELLVDLRNRLPDIQVVATNNQLLESFSPELVLVIHDCWIDGLVRRSINHAAIELYASMLKDRRGDAARCKLQKQRIRRWRIKEI